MAKMAILAILVKMAKSMDLAKMAILAIIAKSLYIHCRGPVYAVYSVYRAVLGL